MKADFSRITFDRRKHYTGVLLQQGRVNVDADTNEDVRIRQNLAQFEAVDVIGGCGVPAPGHGFEITTPEAGADPDDFRIGGGAGNLGHFYVNGLLCELDENASYLTQPDFPNPPRITMPGPNGSVTALVYLEVWDRLISYLQDPQIREVALGGPDTAVRVKRIAQVKVASVDEGATCATADLPSLGGGTLSTLQPENAQPEDPCRLPDPNAFTGRENHLYRVEIHDPGDVIDGSSGFAFRAAIASDLAIGATTVTVAQALTTSQAEALERSGFITVSDDSGRLERISVETISEDRTTLTLTRGTRLAFTTALNGVITGGAATFKWSADNAGFAVPVNAISEDRLTLTVDSLGRDAATALALGNLVEVTDDVSDLGPARGHLTFLAANPDPDALTITLTESLPATFSVDRHLIVRRWDGFGTASGAFIAATTPDMDLGTGVHIQFGGEDLRSGDFWQFTARAIDGSVESLTDAPPAGIIRDRCKLAVVRWARTGESAPVFESLFDCRNIFDPLTELTQQGIHVTGVLAVGDDNTTAPLLNDSTITPSEISGGIRVQCDAPVDPFSIDRPVCFVSVEPPTEAGDIAAVAYQPLVIAAEPSAAGNEIIWTPTEPARNFLFELPGRFIVEQRGILARLILKGNSIWGLNNPDLYLDGEAFGRSSTTDPSQTILRLPSGNKRRGGDFEMWFWLTREAPAPPFDFTIPPLIAAIVRSEGVTELLSDIILIGTGGAPTREGVDVPRFNLQIFLNTNITSRIVGTAPDQGQQLDVLLFIDEPVSLNTTFVNNTQQDLNGVGGQGLDYQNGAAPNVFLGRLVPPNSVVFSNIPIDPPGRGRFRTLRFANLRANAAQLGPGGGTVPSQINAFVSLNGPANLTNAQVVVGTPVGPTITRVENPNNGTTPYTFTQIAGSHPELLGQDLPPAIPPDFRLVFTEASPPSFKVRKLGPARLDLIQPQEQGFDNNNSGQPAIPIASGDPLPESIGNADAGTRFLARFQRVPPGVRIFVTTRDVPETPPPAGQPFPVERAVLLSVDAGGGGGGGAPPDGVPPGIGVLSAGAPIVEIPVVAGSAFAVWERVLRVPERDGQSHTVLENLFFAVVIAAPRAGTIPGAGLGTALVNLGLAPLSQVPVASTTAPIPRFEDRSTQRTAFSVTAGAILFPFEPDQPIVIIRGGGGGPG